MAAACWAEMVTGTVLSVGGAPCFTVFVARAVLSAPLRLILLVGTGLAIGLSPKPMPCTGWTLVRGVDWIAPKPGWIEGVLTTVGWRGVDKVGGMTVMGGGSC